MTEQDHTLLRMQTIAQQWQSVSDRRFIFLDCYILMTRNMLAAVDRGEFHDNAWVNTLLHHFADYYFHALEAFEGSATTVPPVWQVAFDASSRRETMTLQHLLLGINAHINYDLVLTLVDMLEHEWAELSEARRTERHADHSRVNEVIGQTINAVQDTVIDQVTPAMEIVDKLLGPIDEWATAHMIAHWRENVWREAVRLIETTDPATRQDLRARIEAETLRRSHILLFV